MPTAKKIETVNFSKAGLSASPTTSSPVTLAIACERGLAELEATLRGPGMPAGLRTVSRTGNELRVEVDTSVTSPLLVEAIVVIEARRLGATRVRTVEPLSPALAARVLGEAIAEPALDGTRIIETHLAALEAGR